METSEPHYLHSLVRASDLTLSKLKEKLGGSPDGAYLSKVLSCKKRMSAKLEARILGIVQKYRPDSRFFFKALNEAGGKFAGEISKYIIENVDVNGVMLTGGDIAIKTTKLLHTSGMVIKDEIVPGVPYGYFIRDEINKVPIVTKAGGFGERDTIIKVIEFIQRVE